MMQTEKMEAKRKLTTLDRDNSRAAYGNANYTYALYFSLIGKSKIKYSELDYRICGRDLSAIFCSVQVTLSPAHSDTATAL